MTWKRSWFNLGGRMDEEAPEKLELLRAEHRRLDDQIAVLTAQPGPNQLEVARLKRQKLRLRDQIQLIIDQSIPDIIA
jgi:hypothetical protein